MKTGIGSVARRVEEADRASADATPTATTGFVLTASLLPSLTQIP